MDAVATSCPLGGSNSVGALGYVRCAIEIIGQSRSLRMKPDLVVHATSSGGTQAGLIAGFAAEDIDCEVLGINVYDTDHRRIEQRIGRLLEETLTQVKIGRDASPRIRIQHEFLGDDYGIPTRQTVDAITALAGSEGILTDPVYSGKALGGTR